MSTVIKASSRAPLATASFGFHESSGQPEAGMESIRAEAAKILAAAHEEARDIRQRAAEEGRRAGLMAADRNLQDQVAAQVATLLPAWRQAIDALTNSRQSWRAHWEKQAVHLAAAMARRVVRRELQRQPEITLSLVAEALELAAGKPQVRILLNPDDHRALGEQVHALAAEMGRAATTEIVADPSVSRGGCRLETRHGVIDQTIEAQLDRIEQELS